MKHNIKEIVRSAGMSYLMDMYGTSINNLIIKTNKKYPNIGKKTALTKMSVYKRIERNDLWLKVAELISKSKNISFKHIKIANKILWKSLSKNEKKDYSLLRKYFDIPDAKKLHEIGLKGEKIINEHLKEKNHSYNSIINFLEKIDENDFIQTSSKLNYKWVNKDGETYQPFDFIINGIKFDVKTTVSNNFTLFLSSKEYELLLNKKLSIIRVWLDEKFNFIKTKILSSDEMLDSFIFKPTNYIAKKKNVIKNDN
ncbi:MAG: hypothetical protein GY679_03395 [Mycoplasma sp.]|nr:hypothetical protein [Mycoplasma sp.]